MIHAWDSVAHLLAPTDGREPRHDLCEAASCQVYGYRDFPLKFAGGLFALKSRNALKAIIELCHGNNVLVSIGGFIEYVLTQGAEAAEQYIEECKKLGFDIIEMSRGFITVPPDDWLRLIERAVPPLIQAPTIKASSFQEIVRALGLVRINMGDQLH